MESKKVDMNFRAYLSSHRRVSSTLVSGLGLRGRGVCHTLGAELSERPLVSNEHGVTSSSALVAAAPGQTALSGQQSTACVRHSSVYLPFILFIHSTTTNSSNSILRSNVHELYLCMYRMITNGPPLETPEPAILQ